MGNYCQNCGTNHLEPAGSKPVMEDGLASGSRLSRSFKCTFCNWGTTIHDAKIKPRKSVPQPPKKRKIT